MIKTEAQSLFTDAEEMESGYRAFRQLDMLGYTPQKMASLVRLSKDDLAGLSGLLKVLVLHQRSTDEEQAKKDTKIEDNGPRHAVKRVPPNRICHSLRHSS